MWGYVKTQRDRMLGIKIQCPSGKVVKWRMNDYSNRELLLPLPGIQVDSFHLNSLWTFIKAGSETANRDSVLT